MKVIGITTDSVTNKKTGVGNYTLSLIKDLKKNNCKIIAIDSSRKEIIDKLVDDVIIISNPFPFLKTLLWHFFLLARIKKKHIELNTIINTSFFPNVIGNHKNIWFVIYDLSMFNYPKATKFGKGLFYRIFLPWMISKSSKILTISYSVKSEILKTFNVKNNKIDVIYPEVNSQFIRVTDHQVLNSVKLKYSLPKRFYIFVGTIEPRKNISRIFQAFDMAFDQTGVELVMVGNKGWRNRGIEKVYSKMKHKKKVHFLGYVDDKDLPAIYSLAEALVFPSLYEGYGIPVQEAKRCGCPVITSNVSSLHEAAGTDAVFVNPNSIPDISFAMINIVKSKNI